MKLLKRKLRGGSLGLGSQTSEDLNSAGRVKDTDTQMIRIYIFCCYVIHYPKTLWLRKDILLADSVGTSERAQLRLFHPPFLGPQMRGPGSGSRGCRHGWAQEPPEDKITVMSSSGHCSWLAPSLSVRITTCILSM